MDLYRILHQIIPLFFLLLSGCSLVQKQLGFEDVAADVKKRSSHDIYWRSGGEYDALIQERVNRLLSAPLTPVSAVQVALMNNRGIQGVYQELHLAQSDLVEAGLLKNPVLDSEILLPNDGPSFELSLLQDFIGILQIPLRKKIASAQFEQAKIHVVGEVLELAARTKVALYEYQGAKQRLEVARTSLSALEAAASLAARLHDAGNINDLTLQQEQAAYEGLRLEVLSLEQEVIEKREGLNIILGIGEEHNSWTTEGRLSESLEDIEDAENIERTVLFNSTELAETREELLALATQLGMTADFAPFTEGTFGLGASGEGSSWGFGPILSLPLPIFNQGQPAVLRADARFAQKVEEYADQAVRLRALARKLAGQLKIAQQQVRYYKKVLLPLQLRLVDENQKQYNGMLIGGFQLLAAKREQLLVAEKYVKSLEQYWVTHTEISSLMNGKSLEEV